MIEDKELDAIAHQKAQQTQETQQTQQAQEQTSTEVVVKQSEQPVIQFKQKKVEEEPVEIPNEPLRMVKKGVDAAVAHRLSSDEKVQERFLETADTIIETNLSAVENDAEAKEKEAILKNNKDACDLYGIDEKTVPKWVVKCACKVQDFWYAVWLVLGFFTTVPIVFLGKKIKVVVKKTWVSMALAILLYVIATTSPLWTKWLQG